VTERLVAAVPVSHPLADRAGLTLAELSALPLICMPPGTGIRAAFDQSCAASGVQPAISLEASAAATVVDLSMRGLGVAILSESMASAYRDRVRALPIEDAGTPALLVLAWKPSPSPVVAEIIRHCRRVFGLTRAQ
jgi:DNA-binding transcriptional LysR family regulator